MRRCYFPTEPCTCNLPEHRPGPPQRVVITGKLRRETIARRAQRIMALLRD